MRRGCDAVTRIAGAALLLFLVPATARAAGALELNPTPTVLVGLLVGFVILIAPLNAMIFKPLFRVLDERKARIDGATQRAKHLQGDAEQVMNRYRESIREAREAAERERQSHIAESRAEQAAITDEARTDAEREVSRVRDEIAASLEDARGQLRTSASDLARTAADRILGRSHS